jgi:hypothetical protein
MEYFSAFPTVVNSDGDTMTNVCIRLNFINKIKNNASIFQYVPIRTGQRPEDIANIYYGDPSLYWIVLWMNDVVDPYYGWLLTDNQLMEYANVKYANVYATHHYETIAGSNLPIGTIVNQGTAFSQAITNLAYEQTQNEKKRNIKILQPQYKAQVLAEYQAELTGQQ